MSLQPGQEVFVDDKNAPEVEKLPQESGGVHVDAAISAGIAANVEDFWTLVSEANEANEAERGMSLMKALRTYPKAMAWSIILSSAIIMEGYDTSVVGSFWAFPPFLDNFNNGQHIPPSWQNGISGGTSVGEIIGLQLAGYFSERVGYRWTLIPSLLAMIAFIFIPFFATSLPVLLVGEILQGLSWGVFQTMTIAYAADVCPVPIRHWLTSFVNLCWFIGGFIATGVLRGLIYRTDIWGYRIPFALQWIWPVPILIGTFLAPESPWFLVKKGRKAEAEQSLKRLARKEGATQREIDRQLACAFFTTFLKGVALMTVLVYTNELEKSVSTGVSYLDCFKGTELRRTEIVCMTWIAQTMCGSSLGGLQSFFYTSAGLSTESAFDLGLGQTAIGMVGTIASWFIMARVGRRPMMLSGMIIIFFLLIIVGAMGVPATITQAEAWTAGSMVLLISTAYGFTVGPVVYNIVAEIPSTRVRAKSVVLARNAYNIANVAFVSIVTYRQLDASAWGWGSKAGFFWAGSNLLFTIYLYFRLRMSPRGVIPDYAAETKGRTFTDLDILFEAGIPARKFASTQIESLADSAARTL